MSSPGTIANPGPAEASYAELQRLVAGAGLLARQPAYYAMKFASAGLMLGVGLAVLTQGGRLPAWVQLLNAAFLAFVFGQLGLLGHDVAHQQVFRSRRRATLVGLVLGNLLLGIGVSWWRWSHGAHHAHPNHLGADPAVDFTVLAFTPEQARAKPGYLRWVVRHQAKLVVLFACLELLYLHVETLSYLWQRRFRQSLGSGLEALLVLVHAGLYLGVVLLALGPVLGLAFVVIHYALTGLYLASLFAPNHKGMPVIDDHAECDVLREQVLTARNVEGGRLTDFWYGGLNRQIEHHLFPSMPRNHLSRAAPIVRAFCEGHGLAYHETTVAGSYRELFRDFQRVGDVLSAEPDTVPALSSR
jgi:fatty acid desaturase